MNKNAKKYLKLIVLIVVIVAVGAYFVVPSYKSYIMSIVKLFTSMSVVTIVAYIRSFGIYAALISFFLMMFQSVIAPFPAFLITFANAAIFGWWQGAILSWSSAMAGAGLCFFIAKILGRDVVEKLTGKMAIKSFDEFFEKYGKNTILICRLLPFVPFDFVSYGAGLTAMGAVPFFIATGIGQLPATVVYSYVGGMLTGGLQKVVTAMLIFFALTAFIFMFKQMYNDKQLKKAENK